MIDGRRARRWGRRLLFAYAVLLAASHVVRRVGQRPEPPLPPGSAAVEVPAFAGAEPRRERVRLAYRQWGAAERSAVMLLHGSPGSSRDFRRLGPLLAQRFRVVAPDLPGFGRSTRKVPDYSIHAHAHYVRALLDELGLERAHLVGFSMGGGVALHLADDAPERVRSVVLLSAIGLQEFELLGQYDLNHAVHGIQLAGLWLLSEAFPHFGWLDGSFFGLEYARNFYDSDQRPLEGILATLDMPLLVIHGERDVLVPAAAAREHHRRVPQSELLVFPDGDHFMVFTRPGDLAGPLRDFLERADRGRAVRRAQASPERLAEAAEPLAGLPRIHGFALAVWMLLAAAATLVSEDLTCIASGLLVARGRVGFAPAVVGCGLGIFVGDLMLYLAGRLGRPWLGRAPLSWFVDAAGVERAERWFDRRGGWAILASRFLPGTRIATYVTAGLLRMKALSFAIQLLVPVALWTPILVGVSRFFGERVFEKFDVFERYAVPGFVTLLLAVWTTLALVRILSTHRGRRLLVGRWRRLVEWEFWPLPVFYAPVVLRVLWLGLRHRSLTLFTAANPGMPAGGGFIGESKSEILSRLDAGWVARFRRLPDGDAAARRRAVGAFMDDHGIGFPLVLKPDQGQRGDGVRIVRSDDDVRAYLESAAGAAIVQEYVAGKELGVFYVRLPDEDRGRVFAVTDKHLPEVVGDGERTLERLVLDDPRAVAMARAYFAALGGRRDEIPPAGQRVRLVEVGTHCRGAIFGDGDAYRTPAFEDAVERISRSFDGFFFGRYDIRAPSPEAFRDGRDLKVIEVNGVTSEATNIYDPKFRLWDAYGILFAQWRLAFEVGARNRDRGVEPASVGELLRMITAYRRRGKRLR